MFKKLVSLHGLKAYLSTESRRSPGKHVAQDGFASGGEKSVGRQGGTIVHSAPATVALFDDFLGTDTGTEVRGGWHRVNGDVDTGASSSVARQAMTNGVVRISFQGTPLNVPSTGTIGVTRGPNKTWKPDQGRLQFAARVKIPVLASVNAFIGFSDSGGSEQPAYDTGATAGIITPAADAVGFIYSNLGAITAWTAVSARSVAADSGDQSATTGKTPVANTYDVLEIRMGDSGEYADFFVNGEHTNRFTNPVEAKNALTPGVWVFGSDTGTIQVDVDYIGVSSARDSGT